MLSRTRTKCNRRGWSQPGQARPSHATRLTGYCIWSNSMNECNRRLRCAYMKRTNLQTILFHSEREKIRRRSVFTVPFTRWWKTSHPNCSGFRIYVKQSFEQTLSVLSFLMCLFRLGWRFVTSTSAQRFLGDLYEARDGCLTCFRGAVDLDNAKRGEDGISSNFILFKAD